MASSHAHRLDSLAQAGQWNAVRPLDHRFYGLVSLCFYMAIPGFYIYHSLTGIGLIPSLLGGYSSAMASFLPLALLPVCAVHLSRDGAHRTAMDLAFMAYYATVLAVHLGLGSNAAIAQSQIGILAQFIVLYILALLAPLGQPRFQRGLLAFFLLISGIIVANADNSTLIIASLDIDRGSSEVATYQAYAFVYSVLMLYVLAALRCPWQRLLVYAMGLPTLFLNGARGGFLSVVVLITLLELLGARRKLLTVVMSAAAIAAALPFLAEFYPEIRTVFLFIDHGDDISANERSVMLSAGWRSIAENPLLGDFGSYKAGEHIHNGLSTWVDLGIVGLAAYSLLVLLPIQDLFFLKRQLLHDPVYRLSLSLLFTSLLLAMTAKHFTHQLLPLALGVYARHLLTERQRQLPRLSTASQA